MKTSELIEILAADAKPVRPLAPPPTRALLWSSSRCSFRAARLGPWRATGPGGATPQSKFPGRHHGGSTTAVLAAVASFQLDVPGTSRHWSLLPVPALIVWVATIGHGCLSPWVSVSPAGTQLGEAARCFSTVLLTSVPLSVVLFAMLRRGGPLGVTRITLTGSLAVAALSATAVSVFHELEASAMVLMWNLGTGRRLSRSARTSDGAC